MPNRGTTNAVLVLKTLLERSLQMQKDIFIFLCFVDYQKGFDRVKHNKAIHLLDDLDFDDKELRIFQDVC